MKGPDKRPDGIDINLVRPDRKRRTKEPEYEFSAGTRVLYVNGINSTDVVARHEALAYANLINHEVEVVHLATRGMLSDIGTAANEMFDPEVAYKGVAERAIAREIISLAGAGKDVHIMAYSRGALVTQRALEMVTKELERRGFSDEYIRTKVLSHVTVETVNGASHHTPKGVRAVHYVCEGDVLVGQSLGMGPFAAFVRIDGAEVLAMFGDFRGIVSEVRDGVVNVPSGPIIEVPPSKSFNAIAQHDFGRVLLQRQPFEKVYASYEHEKRARLQNRPDPQPCPAPFQNEPLLRGHQPRLESRAESLKKVHFLRDGITEELRPGQAVLGRILSVEGDRITQHVGRGTVTWSYGELGSSFKDPLAFDAMMQPGNNVIVALGRDGNLEIRREVPGQGWESLGQHSEPRLHRPAAELGLGR